MSHRPSPIHTMGPRRFLPPGVSAGAGLVVIVLGLALVLGACRADPESGDDDVGTTAAPATTHADSPGAGGVFEESPSLPIVPPAGTVEFTWQEASMPVPPQTEAFVELITRTADGYLALGQGHAGEGGSTGLLAWQSDDGLEWRLGAGVSGVPDGFDAERIVEGGEGSFLVVGAVSQDEPPWEWRPGVLVSEDGFAWTEVTPEIRLLEGERVSFDNVAAGPPGLVVTGSIEYDPPQPPLEIHKDGVVLLVDHEMGRIEITDVVGETRYTGSTDELFSTAETEEGWAVFHPDSGERLFVLPLDQVFEINARFSGYEEGPASRAPAGAVRDQGQIFSTDGVVDLGDAGWSQSITAGMEGRLAAIQILIETPLPAVLDLAVFEGPNPPTGSASFSQQVTATDVLYTWDLSGADLVFEAGEVFTFAVNAGQSGVVIAANDGPGYDGGELFRDGAALPSTEPNDVAFITWVVPSGADPGDVPSIAIEVDGYELLLIGHEAGRPGAASFEVRELVGGSLIAAGDLEELFEAPPPRFVADGTVVLAFATWEEYWAAEEAAWQRLGDFEGQYYSKPLALLMTDEGTWSDIDLSRGIAANQTAHIADAMWGGDGFVLRGSVENVDTNQWVDVSWTSPAGDDWDLTLGPAADFEVWSAAPTTAGFVGLAAGEGTGVLSSPDGLTWEPVLVVRGEPGTFTWFDSLSTGQLGTFVTSVTEGPYLDEEADQHGDVIFDEEFGEEPEDVTTTTVAVATTQSPALPGAADVTPPESVLYFSPDGTTFFEVRGSALEGRFVTRVLVGGDRVFVFADRFDGALGGDHGAEFGPFNLLVGHPAE